MTLCRKEGHFFHCLSSSLRCQRRFPQLVKTTCLMDSTERKPRVVDLIRED